MIYGTSRIRVSLDNQPPVWRPLLVVSSDKPVSFPTPNRLRRVEKEGAVTTTTTYYTRGLWKHLEEGGKHYYWFLLEEMETAQAVDPEAYQEQLAINDILTGGDGNGTDEG